MIGIVLQCLGALYAAKVAFSLLSYVYIVFVKPGASLSKFTKAKDWAVVTGATDGIGKAYAMALAKKGLNVLLVSRTVAKLQQVQQEIMAKYPDVEVRTHATDFTQFDDAAFASLSAVISSLQVGVLINNVAVNISHPTYFEQIELNQVRDIVTCNTLSTALLTHAVLPQMKERKRGVIVNLSSLSGTLPIAMLQPYGATKSFVENFSKTIAEETKKCARPSAPRRMPRRGALVGRQPLSDTRLAAPPPPHLPPSLSLSLARALSRSSRTAFPISPFRPALCQVRHHRAVQRALLRQNGDGRAVARLADGPRAARLRRGVALQAGLRAEHLALLVARDRPLPDRARAALAARAARAWHQRGHPQALPQEGREAQGGGRGGKEGLVSDSCASGRRTPPRARVADAAPL
jgi:NADP-dependent 3-hydroxy acid dehydrogenase YdfG